MTSRLAGPSRSDRLRFAHVAQLIEARAWPSVSVLLDTTPAERMTEADTRRLESLVGHAAEQLGAAGVTAPARVVDRLAQLADEARGRATSRGLALFASQAVARRVSLPVSVRPRAVVEHTFATRDLVRVLHRTPPYLVLVLHDTCAHLYEGAADTFGALREHGFPLEEELTERDVVDGAGRRGADFLAAVDDALGHARAARPCPLVLAGPAELTARFVDRSEHLQRLAGVVDAAGSTSFPDLYVETRAAVENYLLSREAEALWTLEHALATSAQRVATGLDACWAAARATSRAMLVVEEGFAVATDDLHDAVDDLIENVIERGGWVALTRDGLLERHGRVAMVLESREGSGRS